jgi:hypothetical protein
MYAPHPADAPIADVCAPTPAAPATPPTIDLPQGYGHVLPAQSSDPILDLISRAQETLSMQIGGSHYRRPGATIQPIEFFHDNGIPYPEASAMGYLFRWRDKGGVSDLKKAISTITQLIAMEDRKKARLTSK